MRRETRGALQWTNTEVCLDVWCECGADLHHDGAITGRVSCPCCSSEWVVELRLRDPDANDYPHEPTVLEAYDDGWPAT